MRNLGSFIVRTGSLLVFAFLLCCGCTSPQRHYMNGGPHPVFGKGKRQFTGPNYTFRVIEFDDQGEMWDRSQLYDTLTNIAGLKRQGHPVTLLLFVHGWKNDASGLSGNLTNFYGFFTNAAAGGLQLAEDDGKLKDRHFVGVYIAWRGDVFAHKTAIPQWALEFPRNVSFWNRKRVAAMVGGVSATEAILSLTAQTRMETHAAGTNVGKASRVVLVGHSFGGLLLERAVTQALLGSLLATSTEELTEALAKEEVAWANYQFLARTNAVVASQLAAVTKKLEKALTEYAAASNIVARGAWFNFVQQRRVAAWDQTRTNITFLEAKKQRLSARKARLSEEFKVAEKNLADAEEVVTKLRKHEPPADLLLLVNPASEGLVAKKMIEALQKNPLIRERALRAEGRTRPWIIAVSSKGDRATRRWFRIGQAIGGVRDNFRSYEVAKTNYLSRTRTFAGKTYEMSSLSPEARELDGPRNRQRTYFVTTATHNRALRSHRVELVDTNLVDATNKYADTAKQAQQANRPKAKGKEDFRIRVPMPDGNERVYELRRTPSRNNSGYWVVEAPTELIPDHSRIFTSEFYGLAYGLLSMSRYYDRDPIKTRERTVSANGEPAQRRLDEPAALLE